MEKLREAVIKLASTNQKNPLSSSQIALINQRLHDSFPHGLRLPSHPTYASMIIKAITELSEERGSSKDSISEHVKANCDDLPWAHKSMLSHHLNRLCDEGLIILIASDRYTIPGFTQKTVLKKGKHVGMMKQKIWCQENLKEYREHPHGSACGKIEPKLINERKLRSGRRRLVLHKNEEELVGLDSCRGIGDEHVGSGCEERVVVEGKEEDKGQEVVVVEGKEEDNQEAQESEVFGKGGELEKQKRLSPKQSISEIVKIRHRKRERKCDQLVAVGTEEKSLVDKCQDKTRSETLALEDDNDGGILMNNGAPFETRVKTMKKNGDKVKICCGKRERKCDQLLSGGSDEKSLVDECQDKTRNETLALEGDINGGDLINKGTSYETTLKKRKKDAEKVKMRHSNRRKCDQLVTVGTEEKSVGDECQDKTRNETLALEDDNNGGDLMNNGTSVETLLKKKKDAEKVMIHRSNRERKCDQLVTVGTEEKSVGDECQGKTRNETLALEDDNNGGGLMNNGTSFETPLKKKDAEKVKNRSSKRGRKCDKLLAGGDEEKYLVDECLDNTQNEILAFGGDSNDSGVMNNGASLETAVKKKKKGAEKWTGLLVCGIATKLPKLMEERRVTRQLSKSKEQPNKLIISPVNSLPSSKLLERDNQQEASKSPKPMEPERRFTRWLSKSKEQPNKLIISPVNLLPSSKRQERGNQQEASKSPKPVEPERSVTRKLSVSKEQPNKLIISPVNPLPSSKLQEHDNQPEASKSPKPVQCVTRKLSVSKEPPNKLIISPVNPLPTSKLQEHDNQLEASIQSSQEAKSNWPSWVQSLLQTTFFGKCKVHANVEKSLCNFCCLDCKNGALCTSCLTSHEDHRVIKIKRAVSEDAVDISDIEMNVDISGIHTHKLNADTLIILNRMIPSGHSFAGNVAPCLFCKRPIPYLLDFCSLNCKYEQRMAGSAPCKIK